MNHEHTTWVRKFNKCCGIPIAWRGRKESRASEGLSESLNPKTCTRQTVQKSEGETHVGYRKSLKNYLCRWYWVGQPWSRACGHRKLLEVRGVEVEAGRAILGSPAGADGLKQFFPPSLEPPDETYILCLIFVYILVLIQEPKISFTYIFRKAEF